ncbi:hypothetical protein LWI28_013604 [Acer negundo]|uniref:Uncharacterized protein n=1 Tax=Acer negundo TaxID=4023 RepID=A0AAD5P307_ACENE|nr:hypothetical protein LWI28_013604 [Acer negundo]
MGTLSTPLISLPIQANPEAPTVKSDNRNRLVFSLIEQCTSLRHLKQVHAHMLRTGLFFDSYSASKLFTASTLSPFSSLEYARKVFDEIPEPNLYTWNTLIRAYSWSTEPSESNSVKLRWDKGTIGYVAPENGMGSELSMSGDIYSFRILLLEMFTKRRPTDSMFNDGLNLHDFAKIALPERVTEIVEPSLLLEVRVDDNNVENFARLHGKGRVRMEECLVGLVRIGVYAQ